MWYLHGNQKYIVIIFLLNVGISLRFRGKSHTSWYDHARKACYSDEEYYVDNTVSLWPEGIYYYCWFNVMIQIKIACKAVLCFYTSLAIFILNYCIFIHTSSLLYQTKNQIPALFFSFFFSLVYNLLMYYSRNLASNRSFILEIENHCLKRENSSIQKIKTLFFLKNC